MKKIQSTRPSAIPSWVMMDQRFHFKAPGSFRADGKTSAETQDSNGDPVRVSFDLEAPPRSSRLCLHCPEEREPSSWDFVVASHFDAVLFRVKVDFDGLWINHDHAMDYFIYRASSSSAKLTLLPRCYLTEDEADEEDVSSWKREWRMVDSRSIGLFAYEEHFLVAELSVVGARDSAPLVAKLFRLFSPSSPQAKNGGGQWELTHAKSRGSSVSFMDVVGWETHRVIPFTSWLCWADYNRGILFCDICHEYPSLVYLQLPTYDMPHEDYPEYSCSLCLTDNGDTMKFVNVVKTSSICPKCNPGSGFTISLWTIEPLHYSEFQLVDNVLITDNELWDMVGSDHNCLPRSVPQFPVLSMDDPHILYFVLRGTPELTDEVTAWIVTLDMKGKKVLSYDPIKGFRSDDNISSGIGFFPSNFTDHLMKQPRFNMVSEKKLKKIKGLGNTKHASSSEHTKQTPLSSGSQQCA